MSSPNATASLPPGVDVPMLPLGINVAAILVQPITYLMITTILGAFMVPLLIALFLFSTRALRRSSIFLLNVTSVVLGIAQAIFKMRNEIRSILNPLIPEATATFISSAVLIALGPILVDSILLLRLVAVYPFRRTPRLKWLALVTFPVLIKVFRVVNVSMFSQRIAAAISNDSTLEGANIIETFVQIKMEWIAQLLDNAYISTVFIWRLYSHHQASAALRSATSDHQSLASKIVSLMWIATLNFVFPTALNLTQLIVCYVAVDFTTASYISQANFHITIIGVVLATVWMSGTKWADEQHDLRCALSTLGFKPPRLSGSGGTAVAGGAPKSRVRLPGRVADVGHGGSFTTERSRQSDVDIGFSPAPAKDEFEMGDHV